ncbi:MAG: flagellar biosynthetic protein FliO [Polyangiaceae bacterium]
MTNYGSYLLETFLMLVCVCGAAWAILFGARKLGFGRAKGPISMLGQLPLDARRSVFLVQVGPKVLVVGASEAGLTKLSELEASELSTQAQSSGGAKDASPAGAAFKDVLAKLTNEPASKDDA